MQTVIVGIPILKDARRFHVLKGRRWTIFEHIVLEAVSKSDWTVSDLVGASDLPRRVVIEILIRLMRVGWVHLLPDAASTKFAATAIGRTQATKPELPPVTRPDARYISYSIEQISGMIFRARDLLPVTDEQWNSRTSERVSALVTLDGNSAPKLPDVRQLADRLLEPDEELARVDIEDWNPRKRIGLVIVKGQEIEGLGVKPSDDLRRQILHAAGEALRKQNTSPSIAVPYARPALQRARLVRPVHFRATDLILGGAEHEALLKQIASRARHRVIVHSTFVDLSRALEVIELLKPAVQRGARVDFLWGQSTDKGENNKSREAAVAIRAHVESLGLADQVCVHLSSTRSHAKLFLADTGEATRFVAVVGSCNWLSSGLTSFDASAVLRNDGIVADVAYELGELARPRDGQIPDLTSELVRLARALEHRISATDGPRYTSSAQLVLGTGHAKCLLKARNEAKSGIEVWSHRLGSNAKPTMKALVTAAKGGEVVPNVFYGRLTGDVTAESAQDEFRILKRDGVEIRLIHRPRLHAKVLAWDENDLVVSSLNWLSADPGDGSENQEIGVYLHANGVAKSAVERFRVAREFA